MLLKEYEGKALLRRYGIPTTEGVLVDSYESLDRALAKLQFPIVLKAQIASGSRGKNGGILFAETAEDARQHFGSLIGRKINGHRVETVLVESKVNIRKERYVGLIVNDHDALLMISATGGVEIEDIAQSNPDHVALVPFEGASCADRDKIIEAFTRIGLPYDLRERYLDICQKLEEIFISSDAIMAEINPLVELTNGELLAVDARIDLDPNGLPRQEQAFKEIGIDLPKGLVSKVRREPELHFLGNGKVGLIGLGGGLNLTLIDWLAAEGVPASSVVDIDDAIVVGRTTPTIKRIIGEIEATAGTKAILVNVISCGYEIDAIARDIVAAIANRQERGDLPIALHLQGNRGPQATRIIENAGLKNCGSLREAIQVVADFAR